MSLTTPEAIQMLSRRHPQGGGAWAVVPEFLAIDLLAVALWRSKGFEVHGYEIKVSRSDWLRELKQPAKASPGMARCDFWWLAAPPGVLVDGELPPRWGYIELDEVCHVRIKAPRLRPPLPKHAWSTATDYLPRKGAAEPVETFFDRESFAMMARRFAYAQADRDALLPGHPDPQPFLDAAALSTGRPTERMRERKREFDRRMREDRKRWANP